MTWKGCPPSLLVKLRVYLLFCLGGAGSSWAQGVLDGFTASPNGHVQVLVVQPDGKILIGGEFTVVSSLPRVGLARLLPDGTVDNTFTPLLSNAVTAAALQSDGRVVFAGGRRTLDGHGQYIGRLLTNGVLDTNFQSRVDGVGVRALATQRDGKVVVAGEFSALGGAVRASLGRLNGDGSVDFAFNPGADGAVSVVTLQPDGRILAGGAFTALAGQRSAGLGRLNSDGAFDSSFVGDVQGEVSALARDYRGRIVVGGAFRAVHSQARWSLCRLQPDGTLDPSFAPGTNGSPPTFGGRVYSVEIQADGRILTAGAFDSLQGEVRTNLARFHSNGQVDETFNPAPNGPVHAMARQADGSILVGGLFGSINRTVRSNLARLNPDGSLDATLNPGADGDDVGFPSLVQSLAIQPDGKILIGGHFTRLGSESRTNIGRLNLDGSVDAGFNPGADYWVRSFAVQPDGKIVVGGLFTNLAGQSRNYLGRLNSDGTMDLGFVADADGNVYTVLLQLDGRILVAGAFTTIAGEPRSRLARLNADGTLDAAFNAGANSDVYSLALQSDGQILVGGAFTELAGAPRYRLARLRPDGSLDPGFAPVASGNSPLSPSVFCLAVQSDGKILTGGQFSSLNGESRGYLARILSDGTLDSSFTTGTSQSVYSLGLQADGRIIVAGFFTALGASARNHVGRLNPNGSVDTSFNLNANNNVHAVAIQSDGKVVLGGSFTAMQQAQGRIHVARTSGRIPAEQALTVDGPGTAVVWRLDGSFPAVGSVVFDLSTDGTNFQQLGPAARVAGGWQLVGLVLPESKFFFLRARGRTSGGQFNGSSGLVESIGQFFRIPQPRVDRPTWLSAGVVRFAFTNETGASFTVLATTNVSSPPTNWEHLGPPLPAGAGFFQFADPQATNHAHRFYWLRSP